MKSVSFEVEFGNKKLTQTISVDDKFCIDLNGTVGEYIKRQYSFPFSKFKVTKIE